ncbi:MAG: N-acetyltransferase family protein [Gammaproteobacteria bacterium]|jgi:L-amino acid N-acyltransferase YncA
MVREFKDSDIGELCEIYNFYINGTVITFEESEVTVEQMLLRIRNIKNNYPWLVYEENNEILGYAYASSWNDRSAYKYTAQTTIYLKQGHAGKGIGNVLYKSLILKLRSLSMHCLIGSISLPNHASLRLHEKLGFEKIAHVKEVGFKFKKWIDVGYWQLILEKK